MQRIAKKGDTMDPKLQAALETLQQIKHEIQVNLDAGNAAVLAAQNAVKPLADQMATVDMVIGRVNQAIA